MSEATPKSRGESGQKNAASKPFRMNGRPADWFAQKMGANNVAPNHLGRHMAIAAIGAIMVKKLGFFGNWTPSPRLDALMSKSLDRCPVAGAVYDQI
jgi:hypothetical protein